MAILSLHFLLPEPLLLRCFFDKTDCVITYYCFTHGELDRPHYQCMVDGQYYVNCEAVTVVVQPMLTCISHCGDSWYFNLYINYLSYMQVTSQLEWLHL